MPSNIYHLTTHLTTQRGNKLLEIVLKDNNYCKKKKYNKSHRICPRLLVSSEEFVPQPCPHHRIRAEYIGVVLIDELLYSLLPHLEHLGSSVLHQGELLQHDFFGSLDLFPQVKLGCLWLRLILLTRDISAESKTNH